MKFLKKVKFPIIHGSLSIILAVGAFLRFYGLNWGLPYHFHPDERNMADAVTRFSSTNLDPKFYAYGQFPLYLAYFSGKTFFSIINGGEIDQLSFTQATLALRFWSAIFSTAAIFLAYLIAQKLSPPKKFGSLNSALCAATLVAFTPGLIQSAHFGTTESILTFCFLAVVFFSLNILEKPNLGNFFGASVFLGIALGSKISAAIFLTPVILATLINSLKSKQLKKKLKSIPKLIFIFFLSSAFTLIFSPYLLLAFKQSQGTLLYEISIAQGKSQIFYTRQFINTIPVLFQFQKIFPYALGWPIFILGTLGILFIPFLLIKKNRSCPSINNHKLLITLVSFLVYFILNAFLFTKWTRFVTPIFPFFPIFTSFFLTNLSNLGKALIVAIAIIPGLIFSSIYFKPDIRFTASEWIFKNIPSDSQVLYDTGNVVDIPILPPNSPFLKKIPNYSLRNISFNFYDLDENPTLFPELLDYLESSNYIIVPSRRVFANHMRFPDKYPKITKYYQLLFSGKLGFEEIKTFFPFPQLEIANLKFQISDEAAEETFSVFDHPVIRIYKKTIKYNKQEYENFFKI